MKVMKKKGVRAKKKPKAPRNIKFKRLLDMPSDRVAMIRSFFLEGKSLIDIVRIIQDDWGELTDMLPGTAQRMLSRYKTEVHDPKVLLQADTLDAGTKKEIITRMRGQLDTLDEMKSLCIEQTARYKAMALKAEQTLTAKNESQAAQEGERLHRMLKELASLQMEAGIIPRAPRIVSAHVNFQRTAAEDAYYQDIEIRKNVMQKTRLVVEKMREKGEIVDAEFEEIDETSQVH